MKDFRSYEYDKELCSWCFDPIVTEVYVLSTNKTYCREKCMVSDIQWARSFVKQEEEEIEINNELAKISTDKLFI